MRADDFRYLGPSFILVPVPASTNCKNFFSYYTVYDASTVSGLAFKVKKMISGIFDYLPRWFRFR